MSSGVFAPEVNAAKNAIYDKAKALDLSRMSNAAILPVPGGASTAFVNVSKLVAGSKKVQETKPMKYLTDKYMAQPIKDNYKKGLSGGNFGKMRNTAESILLNPVSALAENESFNAGRKQISSLGKKLKTTQKR